MPRKPYRKDAIVIAAVLAAAVLLAIVSRVMPQTDLADRVAQQTLAPDAVEYLDQTPEPSTEATREMTAETTQAPEMTEEPIAALTEEPAALPETSAMPDGAQSYGPMPAPQVMQVRGYVVLTVNGRQYGDPIAMDRDKIVTIRQDDGRINKVHITPEEVYMESSTCENQDCVDEGHVTLENYTTRVLGAWIICLPNAVTIELVPAGGQE